MGNLKHGHPPTRNATLIGTVEPTKRDSTPEDLTGKLTSTGTRIPTGTAPLSKASTSTGISRVLSTETIIHTASEIQTHTKRQTETEIQTVTATEAGTGLSTGADTTLVITSRPTPLSKTLTSLKATRTTGRRTSAQEWLHTKEFAQIPM